MDDTAVRIQTLTRRLALLEQRTAEETAAIRAELAALQGRGVQPAAAPSRPRGATRPERTPVDLSWLAGPSGLAVAGGAVTLLGVVFVFALAASRGWIGPAVRCSIGGGVSVLLVGVSIVVRRRFGHMTAALAAAGTGIGGCYVTLYAASRGYHLLGAEFVWAGVVLVAALAVRLALSWQTELLAIFGLAAVVIAPPAVEGDLTALGLGASAVAAAAAIGLGAHRAWRVLGGLSYVLVFAQTLVYVVDARDQFFTEDSDVATWHHRGLALTIAIVVFAIAIAGASAYRRASQLDAFVGSLASSSLLLSLLAVLSLAEGSHGRGTAFLALAGAYVLAAVAALLLRQPELATLLVAFAIFDVALATATFLSNGGLLVAWTLEGVTFLVVARVLNRPRYQLAGFAYLGAAAIHLFSFETPVSHLFVEQAHPARQLGELVLFAAALAVTAALLRGGQMVERSDLAAAGVAALLAVYAASLVMLDLSQRLGGSDLHAQFQRGETMVSALWALVALGLLAVGLARGVKEIRYAGLALLALALAKLFLFDLSKLSSLTRAASFLAVGVALLVGGFLVQRLTGHRAGEAT